VLQVLPEEGKKSGSTFYTHLPYKAGALLAPVFMSILTIAAKQHNPMN
jgi:hypothetical protein